MVLDNFRTIELIWDKANKSIIKTIKTASSDTTGRYFSVKILDGGQEVTLNNAKLQLYWEHPNFNTSGTDDFNTVNNGGLFKMTFSNEMLTNIGELTGYLVLNLPDGKITSDGFPIEVIKGADDGVVIPTNGSGLVKKIDGKIDKGNVTLNDLTQDVKLAMTGGALPVVGPESVGNENVKNKAISADKTDFIKSSSNLLNVNNNTSGKVISADGNIVDNTAYDISEFYEIKPGGTYTFYQVHHVLQYSEDGNFISRTTIPIGGPRTLTFPVDRKRIRLNILKSSEKPQFNEGSTLLPYEDYYVQLDQGIAVSENSIKDNSITRDKLTSKSVTIDKTTFLHPTENLADVTKVRNGGYYSMVGVWVDNALFDSVVIDIPSGGDYITNVGDIGGRFLEVAYWGYDGRAVVSNIGANEWSGSLNIPENVRKVAINYRKEADIQKMMFVQGDVLPSEYIPYGFTLDENILISHEQSQKDTNRVTKGKKMLVLGDSITETATIAEDGTNYTEMFTTWVTYAKDILEPTTIKNYARSGAAYRNRDYPGDRRKSLSQQVMMALDNNEEADIIVVSLGTNDGLTKVGDYDIAMSKSSKSELDLTNTAEAARWTYWTLRENYPEATIYCALPIQRADIEPPVELIETIEKVARRYNAIIINATDESGIVKDFEVWQGQGRYLADGLHPHDIGKKMMSKLYSRVILSTYTPNA